MRNLSNNEIMKVSGSIATAVTTTIVDQLSKVDNRPEYKIDGVLKANNIKNYFNQDYEMAGGRWW